MKRMWNGMAVILLIMALSAAGCQSQKKKAPATPKESLPTALERFHDVLRPLHHEALPEKNAQAIRDSLDHLLALQDSVFLAPMPKDWEDVADTLNTLRKQFKASGEALKEAAKGKDDNAVLKAFQKYHDSFKAIMMTLIDKGKIQHPEEHEGENEKEGSEKKE